MGDVQFWTWVAGGLGAASCGLVGVVWMSNDRRVTGVERQLEHKADKSELNRLRDDTGQIFGLLRTMNDKMADNHAEILRELGKKQDRQ